MRARSEKPQREERRRERRRKAKKGGGSSNEIVRAISSIMLSLEGA